MDSLVGASEVYSNASLGFIHESLSKKTLPAMIIKNMDVCSKELYKNMENLLDGCLSSEVFGDISINSPMFFLCYNASRMNNHNSILISYEPLSEKEFLSHIALAAEKKKLYLSIEARLRLAKICNNDLNKLENYLSELANKYELANISEANLMSSLEIFKKMEYYKTHFIEDYAEACEKAFSCGCAYPDKLQELMWQIEITDDSEIEKLTSLRTKAVLFANALMVVQFMNVGMK
ncbi:MAG: hypothetical protein MJ107_05585 [Lachnospiraceae bacterium]|nr:hypothetical protein [Lachnospiraceae bacterium]